MIRPKSFVASIGLLTFANGLNAVLAFGASVLTARALEPTAFGRLAVLMATSAFWCSALDLGVNQILTRRLTVRHGTRLLADVLRLRVLLAAGVTLGGAAVVGLAALGPGPLLASDATGWALLAISSTWQVVFSTEQAHRQGVQRFRSLAVAIVLVNLVRLALVGAARLLGGGYGLLLLGYMLPPVVAGGISVVRWRGLLRAGGSYRFVSRLLPVIGLAGVTVLVTSLLVRLSLWMVALVGGAAMAGAYAVAYQTASLVFTFGSAMAVFLLPKVVLLDRDRQARGFLVTYLRRGLPLLLLMIAGAFAFSELVPLVFGRRYAGTELPTFLLMSAFLASVLNGPFYALQQARLRYGFLIRVHVVQALALVAGCGLLVPRWGGAGAALAELVTRVGGVSWVIAQGLADTRPGLAGAPAARPAERPARRSA